MRNVGVELLAVVNGIKYMEKYFPDQRYTIYPDYIGAINWYTGEWRAKNEIT